MEASKVLISNSYLKQIFKNSLDILILISIKNKKIFQISDAVEKILGYSPGFLVGKNFDILFPNENTQKEELITDINVYGAVFECQKFLHKNGNIIAMDLTATMITLNSEKAMFITLRDSTEKEKHKREIKQHKTHIKLVNQIIRHDILNDLAIIQGALNLFKNDNDEKYLKEIRRSVENSISIIKNMRLLEELLEKNNNLWVLDTKKILKKVIKKYPNIEFNIKGNANVLADATLESVFNNVIHNAIVHGKTKKIDIITTKQKDSVIVEIIDYGIGIDNEIKEKIFKKGFKWGETGNTGLGLYIVKESLKTYDAYITVKDSKFGGARFIINLRRVN